MIILCACFYILPSFLLVFCLQLSIWASSLVGSYAVISGTFLFYHSHIPPNKGYLWIKDSFHVPKISLIQRFHCIVAEPFSRYLRFHILIPTFPCSHSPVPIPPFHCHRYRDVCVHRAGPDCFAGREEIIHFRVLFCSRRLPFTYHWWEP